MKLGFTEELANAKSSILRKSFEEGFNILKKLILPEDDFLTQTRVAKAFANIELDSLELKPIKIALIASSTLDHFSSVLRFWLANEGYAAEIWIAPFDTIVTTVLDKNSELYKFKPDIVWIFTTHRDIPIDIDWGVDEKLVKSAIQQAIKSNKSLWKKVQSQLSCTIIHNNSDIPSIDPFGNFAGQPSWTNRNLLRRYNLDLGAAAIPGVVIFDLDHFASNYGQSRWIDERYWHHSKNAFSFDASGLLAFQAAKLISGLKGQAKKCLILDLDNTLWGGVIGDDSISGIKLGNGATGEAYVDFQRYIYSLKQRGIILAVCSKNEEDIAKEPFIKHPDMKLRLEDIAVFRANWRNKADNIREIANILNIGLDSIVFVDDNPVERNLVKEFLPMVAVPYMPEDPSEYIFALAKNMYFETANFSSEDRERASFYRSNAIRSELKESFTDIKQYLKSLEMLSEAGDLNDFQLPRMAQLINKSNQFHLTGTRYSEMELQSIATQKGYFVRYYKLADKFGDNGLISVVVLNGENLKDLHIETWVMSCRVLARSMEQFIANDIIEIARSKGYKTIMGEYIPSQKNKLVTDLYPRLGFSELPNKADRFIWQLNLSNITNPLETSIKKSL